MIARSLALCLGLCAALIGFVSPAPAQVNVLTQHNDNLRTGHNSKETVLTSANVTLSRFGKRFARDVDGEVYAQPLVVSKLSTPRNGIRNVVFVATMNNSVYAFDADGAIVDPLWKVNLGPPVPAADVQCCCTDISVRIGILSTPVINLERQELYLVSRNKLANGTYRQQLQAIDIRSGKVVRTVDIEANYGGIVFDPKIHNQRSALTLADGKLYIAWASHNDCGPYHGWVMSYRADDFVQTGVYCTTPEGGMAGIWQSGQGLTVDPAGNLYLMTGNGSFTANIGGASFGCSFLKLTQSDSGLTQTGWFTPANVDWLNSIDADLGSAGVLALPNTNLILGGGKEGKLYLIDRSNMGGFNASFDNVVQSFHAANGHIHGAPVYFDAIETGRRIFFWSEEDTLRAYDFDGRKLSTTPAAVGAVRVPGGMPGAFLSVSSNDRAKFNAVIWASHPLNGNANNAVVDGILRAFDATRFVRDKKTGKLIIREIWNSEQNAARDSIGRFGKFNCPTIANGKVYMGTFGKKTDALGTGQLVVYGLL